jgi:uncharacterized protein
MVLLGFNYRNGFGVTQDRKQAEALYRQAAALGDGDGMAGIGVLSKDSSDAAKWFRKAADAGSGEGAYRLAILCELGHGVEKDERQEVVWLRKAEQLGGDPKSFGGDFGSMAKDKLKSLVGRINKNS